MFYGREAYFTSGWNIMDGVLVLISIIDLLMSLISESSPRIFGILRASEKTKGVSGFVITYWRRFLGCFDL
jgi:Ion transport protein